MFSVSRHHQRARQGSPKARNGPVIYASCKGVLTLISIEKTMVSTLRRLGFMARLIETIEEVSSSEMRVPKCGDRSSATR